MVDLGNGAEEIRQSMVGVNQTMRDEDILDQIFAIEAVDSQKKMAASSRQKQIKPLLPKKQHR